MGVGVASRIRQAPVNSPTHFQPTILYYTRNNSDKNENQDTNGADRPTRCERQNTVSPTVGGTRGSLFTSSAAEARTVYFKWRYRNDALRRGRRPGTDSHLFGCRPPF